MTIAFADMFDPVLVREMLEQKFLRFRDDEELPVRVYEYTERAQFKQMWNDVTMQCRGLVVDRTSGLVIARGFPKFFNHNEPLAATFSNGPVEVYDKLDGALGILFGVPGTDRHRICTRGSVRSPQALRGTEIWEQKYAGRFAPVHEWTYLFEIISPITRVVLDYGSTDDLVLLGAVETATGRPVNFDKVAATWPGPVVERFSYTSLAEALNAPPRQNAEGYVLVEPSTGNRVKVKQEDYKQLHAAITGLTAREVWEVLAVEANPDLTDREAGQRFRMNPEKVALLRSHPDGPQAGALERIPDEFYGTVDSWVVRCRRQVAELTESLQSGYQALNVDPSDNKGAAATIIGAAPDAFTRAVWLLMLAGRDATPTIWAHIRPGPNIYVSDWNHRSQPAA